MKELNKVNIDDVIFWLEMQANLSIRHPDCPHPIIKY